MKIDRIRKLRHRSVTKLKKKLQLKTATRRIRKKSGIYLLKAAYLVWKLHKKRKKTVKCMKKFSRRRLRKLAGIGDKLRFQKLVDGPRRYSKILVGLRYDLE